MRCDLLRRLGREEGRAAFRLKAAGGEELLLKDPAGKTVDATTTIALETNVSAVRGEGLFAAAAHYTPGYPNTDEGYAAYVASRQVSQSDLVLSEILAAQYRDPGRRPTGSSPTSSKSATTPKRPFSWSATA